MLGAAGPSAPAPPPPPLSPPALRGLYAWLDRLPLSRPKRHLARDFSDGVMLAEIVKHYHPRLVDLHNYVPTCNTDQKLSNWSTLNRKVFHKLRFCVSEGDIRKVVANTPGAIEPILCSLRDKVAAGAVREDPPGAGVAAGAPDPGVSGADADGLWAGLAATPHAERWLFSGHISKRKPFGGSQLHLGTAPAELPSGFRREDPSESEGLGEDGTLRDPAGGPWEHPDTGVQQLLEEKEQALAILQETVKVLQMKVMRLEHLVQLKDQRIGELTRRGTEPQ